VDGLNEAPQTIERTPQLTDADILGNENTPRGLVGIALELGLVFDTRPEATLVDGMDRRAVLFHQTISVYLVVTTSRPTLSGEQKSVLAIKWVRACVNPVIDNLQGSSFLFVTD
jgi:hypothetical protein